MGYASPPAPLSRPSSAARGDTSGVGRNAAGHVGQRDGIAQDVPAAGGGVERGGDRAAQVGDGPGSAAGGEDVAIDAFHVLGGERLELDVADAGAFDVFEVGAVAGQRVGPDDG